MVCPRVPPQLRNRLSLQRLLLCAVRAAVPHMNFPSCGSESTLEARRLVPLGNYRVSPLLCPWGPHLFRIDSLLPSRYTMTAAVLRDAKSGTRSLFRYIATKTVTELTLKPPRHLYVRISYLN